jgi:hypothetical protein
MEDTVNKLQTSLALVLALGLSAACTQPQQDELEDDASRAGEAVEQAANEVVTETREALNELGAEFRELETTNANLQGEGATAWAETREEIVQAREELETDLARMETATEAEAEAIHARVADNLETITHRVERAELLATDSGEEFVNAAQQRLAEIERDIESLRTETARLPMEVREETSETVESLREQANDVRESVQSAVDAAPERVADQRDELAEDVATLSATVRREMFELQAELDN